MNSFYDEKELLEFGFKNLGSNVLISKKASIYSAEKISIGNNVRIDDFCLLSGEITLGNFIHISAFVGLFGGNNGIVLEDFTAVSSRSVIYADSDDFSGEYMTNPMIPNKYRNVIGGPVILKKHSIIGTGSTVLPNLIIGEGTAVGSMSLVNKSLDDWKIYGGIPCKCIKDRNRKIEIIEKEFLSEYKKQEKTKD